MSFYQTGSLAIVGFGLALLLMSAPMLRVAARGLNSSPLEHEGELISWMTRILGVIVCILGLVTYLQS